MSIGGYKFKDSSIESVQVLNDNMVLLDAGEQDFVLCKEDVIALAKHFKLTTDDLNGNTES